MTDSIKGFRISANRTPYRRAGFDLTEPLLIAQDAIDEDDLEELRADPVVHIAEIEIPSDEVLPAHRGTVIVGSPVTAVPAAVGGPLAQVATQLPPPSNEAETIAQINQVEDIEALDTLMAGEIRPNVLSAIEARRGVIGEMPIKLPTLKADIQALLTQHQVEYRDTDTVADLNKLARAKLNIAE